LWPGRRSRRARREPAGARAQDRKSAPVKLALLVGCGILLPLGVAAWFLFRTQKYHGPNNVAQETLDIFCRRAPPAPRPPAAVGALHSPMGHRLYRLFGEPHSPDDVCRAGPPWRALSGAGLRGRRARARAAPGPLRLAAGRSARGRG